MSKQDVPNEKRRRFLKGATLAGAAALAAPREAAAQAPAPRNPVPLPDKVVFPVKRSSVVLPPASTVMVPVLASVPEISVAALFCNV